MGERVATVDVDREIGLYGESLARYGWRPRAGYVLTYGRPYGQVFYVYSRDTVTGGALRHDVPGFVGSAGSGAVSLRELHERIRQARRTVSDLASPYPVDVDGRPLESVGGRA